MAVRERIASINRSPTLTCPGDVLSEDWPDTFKNYALQLALPLNHTSSYGIYGRYPGSSRIQCLN